jgi:hypothetical protein
VESRPRPLRIDTPWVNRAARSAGTATWRTSQPQFRAASTCQAARCACSVRPRPPSGDSTARPAAAQLVPLDPAVLAARGDPRRGSAPARAHRCVQRGFAERRRDAAPPAIADPAALRGRAVHGARRPDGAGARVSDLPTEPDPALADEQREEVKWSLASAWTTSRNAWCSTGEGRRRRERPRVLVKDNEKTGTVFTTASSTRVSMLDSTRFSAGRGPFIGIDDAGRPIGLGHDAAVVKASIDAFVNC